MPDPRQPQNLIYLGNSTQIPRSASRQDHRARRRSRLVLLRDADAHSPANDAVGASSPADPTEEELRIARVLVRQRANGEKDRWKLQVDHTLDPAVRETISTNRTVLAGIGILAALLIGGAFGWIIRDRVDQREWAKRREERQARQARQQKRQQKRQKQLEAS